MKKLQILGGGCAKCDELAERAREAAESLGWEFGIEKIRDVRRFAEFGVMLTPALAVDGRVVCSGRVPPVEEVRKLIALAE